MRITINNINKAVLEAGINAKLYRGDGYYYFEGDDVDQCFSTSVFVYHLTSISIDQWVKEAVNLKAENDRKSQSSFVFQDGVLIL